LPPDRAPAVRQRGQAVDANPGRRAYPIDSSIFLRAALRGIGPAESFVIDALRFREDLAIARELGCMVIRVVASDDIRLRRLLARGQAFDLETD
jgi:hypothetical protein